MLLPLMTRWYNIIIMVSRLIYSGLAAREIRLPGGLDGGRAEAARGSM